MIVQLGRAPSPANHLDADTAVDFLLACHGRIRRFTDLARRLGTTRDPSSLPFEEVVETARSVQKFFSVGIPLHAEDEDESIAPRLLTGSATRDVEQAVILMSAQHPIVDELSGEVAETAGQIATDPARLDALQGLLAVRANAIAQVWECHLGLEEAVIFPAVRATFDAETNARVLAECRTRRAGRGVR